MDMDRLANAIRKALEAEGLNPSGLIVRNDSIHIDAFPRRYSHDVDPTDHGFNKAEVTVRLK